VGMLFGGLALLAVGRREVPIAGSPRTA
jgi:hypothetical protein